MNLAARRGVALVAALLTLAVIATLALGTLLVTQLDLQLAANRQTLALARAQARSRLTLVMLELESTSQSGEFPEIAPRMPGLVAYSRESATVATVGVEGGSESGQYRSDARIELQEGDGVWKLHIVERR